MALYAEVFDIATNGTAANLLFRSRVATACAVAADAIRAEDAGTPLHDQRVKWAGRALADPAAAARAMVWAVLAQNVGFTVAQILGADDATLLSKVTLAVNLFAALEA